MKKALILFFVILLAAIALSACGGDDIEICFHEWVKTPSENMLKSAATCTEPAVYYSTCTVCGEKGETFTFGEVLEHSYTNTASEEYLISVATCTEPAVYYVSCKDCGAKGEDTFESLSYAEHSYVKNASAETLAERATCQSPNLYYYSCERCGACGENTFALGPSLDHVDTHGDDMCDKCNKPLKVFDDVPTDNVTGKHEFE